MNNKLSQTPQRFAAVVLAADRTGRDPVTRHTGAACKAFASINGIPMIIRVLDALAACELVSTIILCGPPESLHDSCPELKQRIAAGQVIWIPNENSPSRSAESGLDQIPADVPVLLTTADHALLTPAMVQGFLRDSLSTGSDATVGMVRHQDIAAAFPESRRTVIQLRDGGYCGCNLFTFNPRGRALIRFWQQAEDLRKQPWRLIAHVLGFRTVLSYLFGFLTLQQALNAVTEKSGVAVTTVLLDDPRAAVDVDKIEDLILVESILQRKPHSCYSEHQPGA